jgi:ribosomal protein S18 acetylase RimI-like enzyme
MMDLEIRELEMKDLDLFTEFWKVQDEVSFKFYTHHFSKDPRERAMKLFTENSDKVIILHEGIIVGWGNLIRDPSYPGVPSLGICIRPDYRLKGLGHLMLEHLLTLGKSRKYKGIYIQVNKDNEIAITLYLEYEFKIIDQKPNGMVAMRYEY